MSTSRIPIYMQIVDTLIEQIERVENIDVQVGTEVVGVKGEESLAAVTTRGVQGERDLEAAALFIFIGAVPRTDWVGDLVARSDRGFVLSGPQVVRSASNGGGRRWPLERDPLLLETSVPGIFVAGDTREQSIKRVAAAVGDGAMAVQLIHQYLGDL